MILGENTSGILYPWDNFPGWGQFSLGPFVRRAVMYNYVDDKSSERQFSSVGISRGYCQGVIIFGVIFPRTIIQEQSSRGVIIRGQFSSRAIIPRGNCLGGNNIGGNSAGGNFSRG